ncbi:MAG: glycosyltransferase [Alphaproteobacteria bacterium]
MSCRTEGSQKNVIIATIALNNMAGGVERNVVRLANALDARGYKVHLISFDLPNAQSFFDVSENVVRYECGVSKPHEKISFFMRLKLLFNVRKAIASASLGTPIIVFHHGILLRIFAAKFGLGNSVICSERHALSIYAHTSNTQKSLNFQLLRCCKAITVQFPRYMRDYPSFLRSKITAIGNPVKASLQKAKPGEVGDDGRYKLLCVARLGYQKNVLLLIQAFFELVEDFSLWDLHILGEGEERHSLETFIQEHDLQGRVFLHGQVSDPQAHYHSAHLFCLPSKWEGFPNALAEAMSAGLPAVGLRSCDGVNDLIVHDKTGLLIDDEVSLSTALLLLMKDHDMRVAMGYRAAEFIQEYEPDQIYDQWCRLIGKFQ